MTAFTVISNALVAVGAKPFATTMQAFRDNLISAFEGDATAVAAGVQLRRGALSTTLVTQAYSLPASIGGTSQFNLNEYSFCFSIQGITGNLNSEINVGTSGIPRVYLKNQAGAACTGNLIWRYINP